MTLAELRETVAQAAILSARSNSWCISSLRRQLSPLPGGRPARGHLHFHLPHFNS